MLHRKTLLFPFIFLYVLLFFSCTKKKVLTDAEIDWLKQNDSITIALFPYYPPYQFINENNTIEGIFIEYFNLIEDKIDHKFKRVYYSDWPLLVEDAKDKKIDMILEAQKTSDRSQYLNFYSQSFNTPYIIVAAKGTPIGHTLKDFNNKTVAVPTAFASAEYLKEDYPKINLRTYPDEITSLQKIQSGEHDAYFGPRTVANFLINSKNLDNLTFIGETEYTYTPGIAVDKKNTILNQIIQKGINSVSNSERKNIEEHWLYIQTKPFYKKANFLFPLIFFTLLGLIIILDINFYLSCKVKLRTKALKIAKDIAERDNQLKAAFIHNISHEIRTPMNGVVGFSELLKGPNITDNEKKTYTKIIVNSCLQLINSMDNILEISKLQTKQVKLNPEKIDLHEIFDTIFSTFDTKARKKGVSLLLSNNIEDHQRYVITDKLKLNKIVIGLVENAIKYTKRGAILISCTIQKDMLTVTVRDSGIGINTKHQQRIFQSFSQAETQISKKYGGLGLGLTIAKENTNLMGGRLSFSSIPNKGSTFRIEIPFQPITVEEFEKGTGTSTISKESKFRQYIILVAEDGEVNFLVLKTILQKMEGYSFSIHRAENGKEAVAFCKKNNAVDLILMDIKMPEMDGYKATKLIKKTYPKLPVIAQTAYATKEDILNAYRAGCDDFISKPVDPKILKKVMHKYLPISPEKPENKI